MSKSPLIAALTRIDPTTGLVEYVEAVKPYHSKILDVQIEYVYRDIVVGHAEDKDSKHIVKNSPMFDIKYDDCGYGIIWDTDPTWQVGQLIIESVPSNNVDEISNYFTVTASAPPPPIPFFMFNAQSNRYKLTYVADIIGSSSIDREFTISGNVTDKVSVGDKVGVNTQRVNGTTINSTFTVNGVTFNGTDTIIGVNETVLTQQMYPGTMHFFRPPSDVPTWTTRRSAINLTSSGIPPTPLNEGEYFLIPTNTPGEFNIATRRHPISYFDYVDVVDGGVGRSFIQRAEPFLPGDTVTVHSSHLNLNDGRYTIRDVVPVDDRYLVVVQEPIVYNFSEGTVVNGAMVLNLDGYDGAERCIRTQAPDLFVGGHTNERISFVFTASRTDVGVGTGIENPGYGGYDIPHYSVEGWDESGSNFRARTIPTTGDILFPAGFDTLDFGMGHFGEHVLNPMNPPI